MSNWSELAGELEKRLRLRTFPVAYKKFEKAEDLDKIPNVKRINYVFTFCQLPTMARRTPGLTVGVTKDDPMNPRCARIFGLAPITEERYKSELAYFTKTYYTNEEDARKHLDSYPVIPPGEAIVVAPLKSVTFDPDVVIVYGTPAQMMVLLCALQVKDYERFQFFFLGEGSCADSLPQCYLTGKPALSIPCYGERSFGAVEDDELVMAIPPHMVTKAIDGLEIMSTRSRGYPLPFVGPACDPIAAMATYFPV